METVPLWETTLTNQQSYPNLTDEYTTDVAIVGAGFTGISTAYHLQKKGLNTVILEQNTVGSGASGKNGGMMNTGYKLSASDLIKRWGSDDAKRLDQYALDCITAVKSIAKKNDIDCHINPSGHVALSTNKASIEKFKIEQHLIGMHFDREVDVLNHGQIQTEVATPYYQAGLLDPLSHSFQPLSYVQGLAQAASKLGAIIYENSGVNQIKKTRHGFSIFTKSGIIHSKEVVAATDGYTQKIVKQLYQGILPISSFVIATEKIEEETLSALIPNNRNFYDTINLTNYFRRTPDSRLIIGGSGITYPAKEKFFTELYKKLTAIFPQLHPVKVAYQWGGLIGATIDKFPVIGKTRDGIYYATGYTGHGAAQSTLHGELLAKCLVNEERSNTIFEDTELKKIPFSSQKEFIIQAANLYFRLIDKLG